MKATAQLTPQEIRTTYIGQTYTDVKHGELTIVGYNAHTKKLRATTKDGKKVSVYLFIVHGLLQLI